MNKRKPPQGRHVQPYWLKPRMITEAKRVTDRTRKLIDYYFAPLKVEPKRNDWGHADDLINVKEGSPLCN